MKLETHECKTMNPPSPYPDDWAPSADPHFGSDEAMLAWCAEVGITPVKDAEGEWDWHAAWAEFRARDKP